MKPKFLRFGFGRLFLISAVLVTIIGIGWGQKPQVDPLAPKAKRPPVVELPVKPGTHEMTAEDVTAFNSAG